MVLDKPLSALLDDFTVELDLSALPEVLDDVPVELADVLPADLGETVSEREMDRAVDLLVEERVLHVLRDSRVAADPELAEAPRAVVEVEHLDQEVLVRLRRGVHDLAVLEAEPDALDLASAVDRWELGKRDRAGRRVLERRVEELPARDVGAACVDEPRAAGEAQRQIRAVGGDPDLVRGVEALRVAAHALSLGVPVEQARAVEEVLELGERHPRVLRERRRGELTADPLQLVGEHALDVRPQAGLDAAEDLRVDACELTRVLRGLDSDPGVRLVKGARLDRRGVVEELPGCLLRPGNVDPLAREAQPLERVGAALPEQLADRLDQRPGEHSARDDDLPSRLDVQALLNEQLRVIVDAPVSHEVTGVFARVRMRGASSVIATVCSKCAESVSSEVEIDHSSSWMTTSGPPALIIGSMANVIPGESIGPRPRSPKLRICGSSCIARPTPSPTRLRTTEKPCASA